MRGTPENANDTFLPDVSLLALAGTPQQDFDFRQIHFLNSVCGIFQILKYNNIQYLIINTSPASPSTPCHAPMFLLYGLTTLSPCSTG